MKKILWMLMWALPIIVTAQTVLQPGELVILDTRGDGDNAFSFMPLVDLAEGTEIHFTNIGWNSALMAFKATNNGGHTTGISSNMDPEFVNSKDNYGMVTYTAPTGGVTAGKVITQFYNSTLADFNDPNFTGYEDGDDSNLAHIPFLYFSTSPYGDQCIAFQGTKETPTFIWALSYSATSDDNNTDDWQNLGGGNAGYLGDGNSDLPTGLTVGVNAMVIPHTIIDDYNSGWYSGPTGKASAAQWAARVVNPANWTYTDDLTDDDGDPNFVWHKDQVYQIGEYTPTGSAPVATAPSGPTVNEDEVDVELSDDFAVVDADSNPQLLTFVITGGTLSLGTANITFGGQGNGTNGFTASGSLADINTALAAATFTPTPNLYGKEKATISFTTDDGVDGTSDATVTFDIAGVNDDPEVINLPTDVTVTEDVSSNLDLSALTLIDIDVWLSDIILTFSVNHGTLVSSSGGSVVVDDNSATPSVLVLHGERGSLNTFLDDPANITYTGDNNLSGDNADLLTITANDNGKTGTGGGLDVSLGTVNIDITEVNDIPTLTSFAAELGSIPQNDLIEITFDDLILQGDEADVDGTVNGFRVSEVSSGSLSIGAEALSATDFDASTNNVIQTGLNAYWRPGSNVVGMQNAFSIVAIDDDAEESETPVVVQVDVFDEVAPVLGVLSPEDDAVGVEVSANIILTFSESIALGSGNIQIVDVTDATGSVSIDVSAAEGQLSIVDKELTINLNADLELGTGYAVLVEATAIEDLAGNPFLGITDNTVFNFTTNLGTSIKKNEMLLNAYPNPADLYVLVNASVGSVVQLFTEDGLKLNEVIAQGEEVKINMSSCSSGLYIIRVIDEDAVKDIKVIKQ